MENRLAAKWPQWAARKNLPPLLTESSPASPLATASGLHLPKANEAMIACTRWKLRLSLVARLASWQLALGVVTFRKRKDKLKAMFELIHDDHGSGPVVAFLHGYPFDRSMWREQIDSLSKEGYRAIAPDLRGFGQTVAQTSVCE